MTSEVLKNVITYLAAISDMGNRMENDYAKLNMQTAAEFGSKAGSYRSTHQ